MINQIDIDIKKEALRKQRVFSQLNDEEINILASLLVEKHYKAGETIVREGDSVDSVYLILSGEADVCHVTLKNKEKFVESIATLDPGDSVGLNETGFFSISGVRTATVIAKTNMTVLYLSVAAFHGFALTYSHVNEIMNNQVKGMLFKS